MIYDENDKNEVQFIKKDEENKITTYDIDFIDDFKLQVFDIDKNRNIKIEKTSILFCLEGNIKINGVLCEEFNSLFVKDEINDAKIELCEGNTFAQLYKVYGK